MTIELPTISVVVVNYNGRQHLEPCFKSLIKQDYPAERIELILIDNASQDGSLELMAEQFPTVRVIRNLDNKGFAPAVNQGAAMATGEYLALINNDAYADPRWLSSMLATLDTHRDRGVICVGAKMLDWYGQHIDFIGGGVNFYGMGNQFFHKLSTAAVKPEEHEILFACGGAMLIDRQVFLDVGGFDEDYVAYFEDVDFGWRLWVYGYRVMLAPAAVVHHRQHGTSGSMYNYQLNRLFERNALLTMIKNYEEENLQRVLGVSMLLMMQRSLTETRDAIAWEEFNLGYRDHAHGATAEVAVPRMAVSHLAALKDVFDNFSHVWQKRSRIQGARARADQEIMPLFKYPLGASQHNGPYLHLQQMLVDSFGIRDLFDGARKHRVLILSSDPIGERRAGPAIRVVEMARHLSEVCHVILAAPDRVEVSIPNVETVALYANDREGMEHLVTQVEVVIVQGYALRHYPFLKDWSRILVVDLYDPFHLENMHLHERFPPDEAVIRFRYDREVVAEQLDAGDFFLCASERQRDLWLGALGSVGRLSPEAYRDDPTFRSLIDVVPFGIDPTPPMHHQPVMKGVVPGIDVDDVVVLWGGGIWDWLDPLTVIRAMEQVQAERSDVKLFFLGTQHPSSTEIPQMMTMYDQAVTLAADLGLLNRSVFFNDQWVEYEARANYLLEADIGVSAHGDHIETRFAFRTRLLDYIWAGLPMVVTAGDTLADTLVSQGLGYTVEVGDSAGFAASLLRLASERKGDVDRQAAFAAARHTFSWPQALRPLLHFCRHARYAPDKIGPVASLHTSSYAVIPPETKYYMEELEAMVAQKNEHITYLEGLIKQIEASRLQRILRLVRSVGFRKHGA
jgi:GT2 family glycosyltransferase/glycosyltransferase involved in cell wall biosynthesis